MPTRAAIVRHIHALARDKGLAVLWATHLIDEIEPQDDLIVLHQGRIIAEGTAEEVARGIEEESLEGAFNRLIGAGRPGR